MVLNILVSVWLDKWDSIKILRNFAEAHQSVKADSTLDKYGEIMGKEMCIGIDGCRAGWFFVSIGPGDESEFGVFENIEKLFTAYDYDKWMLIDIPIGLPYKDNPTRTCDNQARKMLSPKRHHSIFSPPCREALSVKTYQEACETNQKITGRKISQQAYHVSKKIREVDGLLHHSTQAGTIIRESHPEICFWALAGGKPMDHYKKSKEGLAERLEILKHNFPRSSAIYKAALDRYKRKEVARDDILDALVLAVTASMFDEGGVSLPQKPEIDRLGLPMEIVYALPESPARVGEPSKQDVMIINDLEPAGFNTDSRKISANGTYAVVEAEDKTYLQINTGIKSTTKNYQTIRFGPKAIKQLKAIIEDL